MEGESRVRNLDLKRTSTICWVLDFELKEERHPKGLGSGPLRRGCPLAGTHISLTKELFSQMLEKEQNGFSHCDLNCC